MFFPFCPNFQRFGVTLGKRENVLPLGRGHGEQFDLIGRLLFQVFQQRLDALVRGGVDHVGRVDDKLARVGHIHHRQGPRRR